MCLFKNSLLWSHFGKLPQLLWSQISFRVMLGSGFIYSLLGWRSPCLQKAWCSWTNSYCVIYSWHLQLKRSPKQSHGVFRLLIWLLARPSYAVYLTWITVPCKVWDGNEACESSIIMCNHLITSWENLVYSA